jgi:hypothetical protein
MTHSKSSAIVQLGRRGPCLACGFFKSGARDVAIADSNGGGRGNGGGLDFSGAGSCGGGTGDGAGNGSGIDGPVFTSFATGMCGFFCGAAGAAFGGVAA